MFLTPFIMAECSQTPLEFIQDAFSPQVAVLCSHDAELLCKKNNLSFVEMTRPFCRLTTEAIVRDSGNIVHTIRNLRLTMKDMNSGPPQPTLARKMLSDAVANALPPAFDLSKSDVMSYGNYDLQFSATCPWFEAYRECFLQVLFPSDHEFVKHHLACIFVVSSSHADPMDQFNKLTQQQHQQQHQQPNKLPKWFCPNIMRYYVLINDVSQGTEKKAESIYQSMKSTYGMNNCHLLHINSRIPGSTEELSGSHTSIPDPWSKFMLSTKPQDEEEESSHASQEEPSHVSLIDSAMEANEDSAIPNTDFTFDHPLTENLDESDQQTGQNHVTDHISKDSKSMSSIELTAQRGCCLSLSDHDRLRIFIHEFILRGLIPWAERTLRILNDQVSTKKGVGRSFITGAKKWFGGNKPTPQNPNVEKPNVVYTPEAPEMQLRRLADLSFMFQLYESAYQTYHQCKRDFNNDHAWLHFAGAMEMAAISVLMQGNTSQRQFPTHYMESAMTTYQTTCKLPNFATRTTLLNCEALKSKYLFNEAAVQYIKMTSEDSDLRSALLLEQAAHCFLRLKVPMPRKYSFHMILAGHRFSKAGRRRHAMRAYSQALQTYKGKHWSLAEDHINFTIGRQSFNLKQLENATLAFKHLLSADSRQPVPQQNAFLREYLFVFKQLESQNSGLNKELPQLPLPVVDGNATKVLCCHPHSAKEGKLSACSTSHISDETQNDVWRKLEELVLVSIHGSLPSTYQPSVQCYTNSTVNTNHPLAVIGELISIEVNLVNPMKVHLVLSDVSLLWRFLAVHYGDGDTPAQTISNETVVSKNPILQADEFVQTQSIPEMILQGGESRKVYLTLRPTHTGELHVTGVGYNVGTSTQHQAEHQSNSMGSITVRGKVNLECQGPRLNNTKAERAGRVYGTDKRLDLLIVPQMPRLEVHFCDLPESMLQGEIRRIVVEFTNCGQAPLTKLTIASTNPEIFTFARTVSPNIGDNTTLDSDHVYPTLPSDRTPSDIKNYKPDIKFVETVPLAKDILLPGETQTVAMWICAPSQFSDTNLATSINLSRDFDAQFVFYYEPIEKHPKSKLRHRVLHHTVQLQVRPSVSLRALATRRSVTHSDHASTGDQQQCSSVHLSLTVQNLNNDVEWAAFHLTQVSTVSEWWGVQHLTPPSTSMEIGHGESTLLSFVATKDSETHTDGRSRMVSTVSFNSNQVDMSCAPCIDLYYRSQHAVTFNDVEVELPKPAMLPDGPRPPSNTARIEDVNKLSISLIVLWQASCNDGKDHGFAMHGQSHVTITELGKMTYNPRCHVKALEHRPVHLIQKRELNPLPGPSEAKLAQLLRYTLSYAHSVQHDFTKHRMCRIHVQMQCNNISAVDLLVEIDTGQSDRCKGSSSDTSSSATKADPPSQPPVQLTRHLGSFLWTSQQISCFTVKSHATTNVTLTACFCKPGVYNMATLQVKAKPTHDIDGVDVGATLQKSPSPCLIVIAGTSVSEKVLVESEN